MREFDNRPADLSDLNDQDAEEHLASLRYAGMIQRALMPDPYLLKGILRDLFVLFLPRDIVSGDFYYTFSSRQFTCIAAGDCTGHGVPGALMSILGISFLNEILQSKGNIRANRVLNQMREKVMKALNQTGIWRRQKTVLISGIIGPIVAVCRCRPSADKDEEWRTD
jgi:serine phosphatase RsbU (regulator of sigma subunit)